MNQLSEDAKENKKIKYKNDNDKQILSDLGYFFF
jgi:hypothetical protein